MSIRCYLFGHAFIDGFKYRKCLRCGKIEKKVLKGIYKELDKTAQMELEIYCELLIIKARHDALSGR